MSPTSNTIIPIAFRRITNQEARERREKGLCYYCDEKFIPGQHSERPQLFMIEDSPPSLEGDNDAQSELQRQESIP